MSAHGASAHAAHPRGAKSRGPCQDRGTNVGGGQRISLPHKGPSAKGAFASHSALSIDSLSYLAMRTPPTVLKTPK